MSELGFFPIFLEKDLSKVDKILGLTFFLARKDFEGFKTAFFHLLLLSFVVDGLFMHLSMVCPRMGGPGNPRELDFVKRPWVGILTSTTVPGGEI